MDDEARLAVRSAAREFAQRCIAPIAKGLDAQTTCSLPGDVAVQAREIGLTAITAPEEWGGSGDLSHAAAAVEEVACVCPGFGVSLASVLWSLAPLARCAEAQRAEQIFRKSLGRPGPEGLSAVVMPDSGRTLDVKASAKSSAYALDGESPFVVSAGAVGLLIVFAGEGETRVCAAVPNPTDGLRVSGPIDKLGLHVVSCFDVRFEGALAQPEAVLASGEEAKRLMTCCDAYRHILVAAAAVGCSRASLRESAAHALERRKGGKAIGRHDAVAAMLADMRIGVESSRAVVDQAASSPDDPALAISARIHATDVACRAATSAVQLFGGYGYMRDLPVEKLMRDSQQLALIGGSNGWLRVHLNALTLR
jgi:alkylation response protein AidB-like acyl-CoA dehydrogenase